RCFHKSSIFAAVLILGFCGGAAAAQEWGSEEVREQLASRLPGISADDIRPSEIVGVYEVMLGADVFYLSSDGRYALQGDLLDLLTQSNVTELRRSKARLTALNKMGKQKMIEFVPDETRHIITVFTDIDCQYCRALHRQIDEYHELGIGVRYVFFPRSGLGSGSWAKAEQVWCSSDRRTALTRAKTDKSIDGKSCQNSPVLEHFQVGRSFGIHGTPAIITDDGYLIAGYLPPVAMAQRLDEISERFK
ncbi:MAG: thioredoxin fold domain-containing protein, partial [Gammaproteobacteria bacterium]|nr:thioredoxin fold domain-containing protein [Gammaproteobacteria bacterium]